MGTLFRGVVEKGGEAQSEAEANVKELLESKDKYIMRLQKRVEELEADSARLKELEGRFFC